MPPFYLLGQVHNSLLSLSMKKQCPPILPHLDQFLLFLYQNKSKIVGLKQLLEQLYALEQDAAAPNLVEVYVARLRRYLGKSIIQTRRGQGYFFASH